MGRNSLLFNHRASSPPTVTMWKARYVSPHTGDISIVQTAGGTLRDENVHFYTEAVHKGHLKCAHCEAKVHHREGTHAIGGNSAVGHDSHFATNPKQKHGDDCQWEFPEPWNSDIEYDRSKGWRVHINVPYYNEAIVTSMKGVYKRVAGGRVRTTDPDMRAREPHSVESASDLVKLIERGDFERLADSIVIFRNKSLEWKNFCLRYGAPSRYDTLIKSMQEQITQGAKQPETFGLFEFRTKVSHAFYRGKKPVIDGVSIDLHRKDYRGKPENIILTVDMYGCHDAGALVSFEGRDRSFLILGAARYRRHQASTHTTHYFNIKVASSDQILAADIQQILEHAQNKGATKASRKRVVVEGPDLMTPVVPPQNTPLFPGFEA